MRGFRAHLNVFRGNAAEVHTSEEPSIDPSDIPETKRIIIENSLESLGVTMYSGALRDSVCNVAGALIMQKESAGSSPEHLQQIIDNSMRDLGFHIDAREKCGGDPDKAAVLNLAEITAIVEEAYGNQDNINEATTSELEQAGSPERVIAA